MWCSCKQIKTRDSAILSATCLAAVRESQPANIKYAEMTPLTTRVDRRHILILHAELRTSFSHGIDLAAMFFSSADELRATA
jgi:hypothetical protein